jgi:hypothetical protein
MVQGEVVGTPCAYRVIQTEVVGIPYTYRMVQAEVVGTPCTYPHGTGRSCSDPKGGLRVKAPFKPLRIKTPGNIITGPLPAEGG